MPEEKFIKLNEENHHYLFHILHMHSLLYNNYNVIESTIGRRIFREYLSCDDYMTLMCLALINEFQHGAYYNNDNYVNSSGRHSSIYFMNGNVIDPEMYNENITYNKNTLFDEIYNFETKDLYEKYKKSRIPEERFMQLRRKYLMMMKKYFPKLYDMFVYDNENQDIDKLIRLELNCITYVAFNFYSEREIAKFEKLFESEFDIESFMNNFYKVIADMNERFINLIHYKTIMAFKNIIQAKFPELTDITNITLYSHDKIPTFIFHKPDFTDFLRVHKRDCYIKTIMRQFTNLFIDYKRWRLLDYAWANYIAPTNDLKRNYFEKILDVSFVSNNRHYFAYHTKNGFDLLTSNNSTSDIMYMCENGYMDSYSYRKNMHKYFNENFDNGISVSFNGNIDDFIIECDYYYNNIFTNLFKYKPLKFITLNNDNNSIIRHYDNDKIVMLKDLEYYNDIELL